MGKAHIKRLSAPKSWPIKRKENTWVTRPNAGPHNLDSSMSIGTVIKDLLGYVKNTKETKYVLSASKIMVNGKVRKDLKFPVGIMDVLSVGEDSFRIIINKKGKLIPIKIPSTEAKLVLRKVSNKTSLKDKKVQVNFEDGTNLLSKEKYQTGDTVVFSDNKVKDHLKFEKGAMIYITAGKQVGQVGVIKEVKEKKGLQPTTIIFTQWKENHETPKKYVFIVGKTKPLVSLSEWIKWERSG